MPTNNDTQEKKPRGRPRKTIKVDEIKVHDQKKSRGRPRKSKEMSSSSPKTLEPKKVYTCDFCGKTTTKESVFLVHACEQKRRWFEKDLQHVRYALYAYQRFYKLQFPFNTKTPTYEEFMASRHYIAFVKFGKYLIDTKIVFPMEYVDYVIKGNYPIDQWTSDILSNKYIIDRLKKETPYSACERNVKMMQEWADEHNEQWFDFFRKVNTNRAVSLICNGRLSPWLIYTANSANLLLNRLTDEQLTLIKPFIEPIIWKAKLALNKKDTRWLKQELSSYGI